MEPESDDGDTLYPNGTGWKLRDDGFTSFHSFRDVPREQWCWSIHCNTLAGGCGVEMSGNSREEALTKWNTRKDNV